MLFVIRQLKNVTVVSIKYNACVEAVYVHSFEGNSVISGVIGVFDFRCVQ